MPCRRRQCGEGPRESSWAEPYLAPAIVPFAALLRPIGIGLRHGAVPDNMANAPPLERIRGVADFAPGAWPR
ncbi:MAG: hypothetical protein QOH48_2257 [Actinomycetota bacterium]|jgi:hypothetical protein|nr:hypothetical protein [Actinomycetota bacterium]